MNCPELAAHRQLVLHVSGISEASQLSLHVMVVLDSGCGCRTQCHCQQHASQVPIAQAEPWPLLLLDAIHLPGCPDSSAQEDRSEDDDYNDAFLGCASVVLLPDAAMPDRLFCCTATAAFSVTLPWLPILAQHLSKGAHFRCWTLSAVLQHMLCGC